MSEPKVSIVMPVYNPGVYLKEAIQDILNQTYTDFELICVDDGSTDQSPYLLSKYAEKDDRIKIITQENKGAGVARNAGMDVAQGTYIWFPDSDDRYDNRFLELTVAAMEEDGSDMAVCGSMGLDVSTGEYTKAGAYLNEYMLPEQNPFSGWDIPDRIFRLTAGWAWDKLYRSEFLREEGIRFQGTRIANDAYAVFIAYTLAKSISAVRDSLVIHRINVRTSIENTRAPYWRDGYKMLHAIKDGLIAKGVYELYKRSFINFAVEYIFWNMTSLNDEKYYKEFFDYTVSEGLDGLGFFEFNREFFYNTDVYDEMCSSRSMSAVEFLLYDRKLLSKGIQNRDKRISELTDLINVSITNENNEIKNDTEIKTVPIVFSVDSNYVPILFTAIQSILDHITEAYIYKVFILHKEIGIETQAIFDKYLKRDNFEIEFIDISDRVSCYNLRATDRFPDEAFYRLLIPEIMKDYQKVIYLDCDTIICHDLAELIEQDLEDCAIGATYALAIVASYCTEGSEWPHYMRDVLNIDNPLDYLQSGVLLIDTQRFRQDVSIEYLMELATTYDYWCIDQCLLSKVFSGRFKRLNIRWNVLFDREYTLRISMAEHLPGYLYNEYEEARTNPYIIHYAGGGKPWNKPGQDLGYLFWNVARRTPYYEQLIAGMLKNSDDSEFANKYEHEIVDAEKNVVTDETNTDELKLSEEVVWLRERVVALENSYSYRFGNLFMRIPYKVISSIKSLRKNERM